MNNGDLPQETTQSLLRSWQHKPWLMLGIGYYFAFSLSVVVNCPNLVIRESQFYPMLLVRIAFSATISIGLIVMMLLIRKFDMLNSGKWVITLTVGLTSMGTIMLIVALNYINSISLMLASTTLIGIGNSVLLLSWGAFFQGLDFERLAGHATFSCLFAAIFCAAIHALPLYAYYAVVVILPLASGITLVFCTDEQSRTESNEVVWRNGLTKILISCTIMGVTCGLLRVLPVFSSTAANHANAIYAVMILIFTVNLALIITIGKQSPILFLYRICVPLFIIGYGLLIVDNLLAHILSIACALGGSILFECLVFLIFPCATVRAKGLLAHLFGWCAAAKHAGAFIGFLIGDLTTIHEMKDSAEIAIFSLVAIAAFVCLFFFIFKELDIIKITEKRRNEAAQLAQTAEMHLSKLSEKYHLSPRETEVLKLLSSGRSLPYIEKELVISHSTARTHVRHIYEKLGIHNRQQLHDLIER